MTVDIRAISLCVTTYNRDDLTYRAIRGALDDNRVSEIVIVDDNSNQAPYESLRQRVHGHSKVKLYRNAVNLQCYRNKREAISKASNEYVIILDSDNFFEMDYIDALFRETWSRDTILAPDWARPTFDYRHFAGQTITRENVAAYLKKPFLIKRFSPNRLFGCMINTMNYFVHRDEYIRVFDNSDLNGIRNLDPWTADTMYQNFNWLKSGNKIRVVAGMRYRHVVHKGSHYLQWVSRTRTAGPDGTDFAKQVERALASLR